MASPCHIHKKPNSLLIVLERKDGFLGPEAKSIEQRSWLYYVPGHLALSKRLEETLQGYMYSSVPSKMWQWKRSGKKASFKQFLKDGSLVASAAAWY